MLGTHELLVIAGVVVLLFGANKLPELARSIGRAKAEFRKGLEEGEKKAKEEEKKAEEEEKEK